MRPVRRLTFRIREFETDKRGDLHAAVLSKFLQEAATVHAAELGVSVESLVDSGVAWVLRRLHLNVTRWPKAGDEIFLGGTTLPGGLVIPLNRDGLTDYILKNLNTAGFQNFMVDLDGQGKGTATLDTLGPLSPQFIGRTMSFAFTLTGSYDFVSNPIDVRIE